MELNDPKDVANLFNLPERPDDIVPEGPMKSACALRVQLNGEWVFVVPIQVHLLQYFRCNAPPET